jgi:uncharacterized protein involved in outer membrane biogenesis
MKRILLYGGGAVAVIVAAVAAFLIFGLGSALKTAVETIGSDATQTQVTLNEADVSLASASGALRGLVVGNPGGYATSHALRFDETRVTLDPASVTGDVIVIKEIVVQAPDVIYEMLDSGANNIDTIRANVDAYASRFGGAGGSAGGEAGAGEEGGTRLIIENLYIRDGKVALSSNLLQGQSLGAGLPEIHLTDIGKAEGGATPAAVVEQVMAAIARGAHQAVATINLDDQLKALMPEVPGIAEGAAGALEEIAPAAPGTGDILPEGTEKATDALKGVLGQ